MTDSQEKGCSLTEKLSIKVALKKYLSQNGEIYWKNTSQKLEIPHGQNTAFKKYKIEMYSCHFYKMKPKMVEYKHKYKQAVRNLIYA